MTRTAPLLTCLALTLLAVAAPLTAPPASAGLADLGGPGTQLAISATGAGRGNLPTAGGTSSFCTANWVWKDQSGNFYLGTAGHCVLPNGKTTLAGPDFYDTSNVRVFACRSGCVLGGRAGDAQANSAVLGPASDWVELGPVAYARFSSTSVADDFALVAIPAALVGDVSPDLKGWGGPVAASTGIAALDGLVLHGAGSVVAETIATKSRAGAFTAASGPDVWVGDVLSHPGDSGAAVGQVVASGPYAGQVQAAGILTQAVTRTAAADAVMKGPTVPHLIGLAHEAGLCLEVVLGGHDLATEPPAAAC